MFYVVFVQSRRHHEMLTSYATLNRTASVLVNNEVVKCCNLAPKTSDPFILYLTG